MLETIAMRGLRLSFAILGHATPDLAGRLGCRLFLRPRRHPVPERERSVRESGRALVLPGGLHGLAWGSGPRVMLVHGWEGRGTQFSAFVAPLTAAGFEVVAFDAPAHGESPGHETHPPAIVRAVLDVGRALGPLAGVVAHSLGAACTVVALSEGLQAGRVALLACPASMLSGPVRFATSFGMPPAGVRALVARVEERVGISADEIAPLGRAPRLSQPALLIHDREDHEVPVSEAEALARAWPGAQLAEVRGLGHRRILRDSSVVARVVGFLASGGEAAKAEAPAL